MIFAPSRLSCKTYEIRTGDKVMVAYLASPKPGEEAFSIIRVGLSLVSETIDFLVVDQVQRKAGAESVPRSRFVGVQRRFWSDPLPNKAERVGFVVEHAR
jgi:hypothetical protein